jgi:FMN phosphatase YigB (HAD superfamily)
VDTPLSAIVFDVADVLCDATLWRRWLVRLVNRMGLAVDYEGFCRVWHYQYQRDVHSGRREFSEALHSFLLAWGLSWAQIDEIEAASRIQCEDIEHSVRALPGIVKTVARLSERGLPLLAWADMPYPAGKATELLDRLGLTDCFQVVLSSFDLGCAQPSIECYRWILEAFRLPAGEVAYVGHDGANLAGARAAGLRTVTLNDLRPALAHFRLTRAEELLDLIDSWSIRPQTGTQRLAHDSRVHLASRCAQENRP